ncbi:MAG: SDR family NAD(P)-dependent oxidoreductase [Candidatus Ratteibacteria bacterium]|jgi:NAD(P)-dependent dehydrogenase (short-subunit alcohol dehydrogenase family)
MKLQGKVALITGGAQGIGRAAVELFAEEGATVVITDISKEGEEVARDISQKGKRAFFIRADISKEKEVVALFHKISKLCDTLHILYANAGVFLEKEDGPIDRVTLKTWEQIVSINLTGTFLCCKYGIPLLIKNPSGSIITTSSSAGVIGVPDCAAYTATKGAIISLTRSMAIEYGKYGLRVNCIVPCAIETEMNKNSANDNPAFDEAKFLAHTPLRRYGSPKEVAQMALFLASDESGYSTGGIFPVDGANTIKNWSY